MLVGSVGIKCTSSADEADKGPLVSHNIGRKPELSIWRIAARVMMDARLATPRLVYFYPGRSQSRKHH